jgi:[protein-PII] uridylyltransferase
MKLNTRSNTVDLPPRQSVDTLIDSQALGEALEGAKPPIAHFRKCLATVDTLLAEHFHANVAIEELLRQRTHAVDKVIVAAWQHFTAAEDDQSTLVAVGGYGRGALHPHSDIDLMVLLTKSSDASLNEHVGKFLTFLWDIGLEVGHSVRTLDDCEKQARDNLTIVTTLMESRRLAGSQELFDGLSTRVGVEKMWSSSEFFQAKLDEQNTRHLRYDDTAYNLEPNMKGSPGGLRDLQMIGWVAQRHFGTRELTGLVDQGFLTPEQLRILLTGQTLLWRIRFGLHLLVGRREDRLLFDHQIKLAQMLGYEDAPYTLAIEQLMQRYYRTVMELSRLNEMLLQLFEEAILGNPDASTTPMGAYFQSRNGYLEAVDEGIFVQDPSALLEIFLLLEKNLDLKGVNARTIALIRQHLWLIDEEFRQNPRNQRLFLNILRAPQGVTRTLRRMNTYGVLGLYIPAFSRIVGRMQYDLFHAYTVDAHTLFVVENLRRASLPRFDHEYPNCSRIMQSLATPEIAYLGGLFHDIAKGRGGDHSQLGAVDAEAFCLEHGMSRYDARLVAWLVQNHLLLSVTAQKKDLNDPQVISEFAQTVGDETHLDYLYVLTVADVRGTNPKIWNSWKDTLFWELYELTKRALRRGLAHPIDAEQLINETQLEAESQLEHAGLSHEGCQPLWSNFTEEYFLRHKPGEIAWHTRILANAADEHAVVVNVNDELTPGLTALMVSSPQELRSFVQTTAVLDEIGLTIVDARIVPMRDTKTLNTYFILETDGSPISGNRRLEEIHVRVLQALNRKNNHVIRVTRRAPRQSRMFSTPVRISVSHDPTNQRTVLELVSGDRPGLLAQVGKLFVEQNVRLQNAKITTLGERAEDVFFVTTDDNRPLNEAAAQRLVSSLETTLANPETA